MILLWGSAAKLMNGWHSQWTVVGLALAVVLMLYATPSRAEPELASSAARAEASPQADAPEEDADAERAPPAALPAPPKPNHGHKSVKPEPFDGFAPFRVPQRIEVLPGAMARGIGKVEGRAIWLGTLDRQFIFRFSGFVHLDMRFPFLLTPEGWDGSVLNIPRRARFAFEGTTFGNLDYRFMFDPAVDKYPLDAYVDWRYRPEVNLRVGKFKSPFGFERRARAFALPFNERAFPTLIAPNRDVGVFVHGQTIDGFFSYDVAVLGGAADLESIQMFRGTPEAAGRLYLQPFRLWEAPAVLREFGMGLSATWGSEVGSEDDPRLGAMTSTGRERFFQYRIASDDVAGTFADGARKRGSVHGHWRYKRFNTMWEYVWSGQQLTAGDASRFVANQAWQAYVGMALTDDDWGFFGIVPNRPFDPSRGQYGAVALAARYHEMRLDPGVFPTFADPDAASKGARSGSMSLQWIHNENLSAQADAEAVFYQGGAPGGLNRPTELTFTLRIQAFY